MRINKIAHKTLDNQSKLIGIVIWAPVESEQLRCAPIVRVFWPDRKDAPINTKWIEKVP